jgi:hypothetical protein
MFGGFLFGFRLGRKFSEVFHHGIGIDFPNRVFEFPFKLAFRFSLELSFPFELAFAEKAADYISYGAEPALALYFAFEFALEFTFAFEFAFEFAFKFVLGLISHIDSSSLDLRHVVEGFGSANSATAAATWTPPLIAAAHLEVARYCCSASPWTSQHAANLFGGFSTGQFARNRYSLGCLAF